MARKLEVGDKVKLSAHGLRVNSNGNRSGLVQSLYPELGRGQRKPKDIYKVREIGLSYVRLGKRTNRWLFKKGPLTGFWVKRDWVKKA